MEKILIIGTTSAIAEACARRFASEGKSMFLYGRNKKRLEQIAEDLKIRGAKKVSYDIFHAEKHQADAKSIVEKADRGLNGFDTAILAHGALPDQQECEKSIELTQKVISINLLSMISYLTELGEYFKKQGAGNIVVMSSVAGDRGRKSNYVYGTTKGGLSLFCQGLRNRLYKYNINVITVKPGFVDTPMTTDFKKKGILWTKPDRIAKDLIKGINNRSSVVYTPRYWFWIMLIIKIIPERIFKQLNL